MGIWKDLWNCRRMKVFGKIWKKNWHHHFLMAWCMACMLSSTVVCQSCHWWHDLVSTQTETKSVRCSSFMALKPFNRCALMRTVPPLQEACLSWRIDKIERGKCPERDSNPRPLGHFYHCATSSALRTLHPDSGLYLSSWAEGDSSRTLKSLL